MENLMSSKLFTTRQGTVLLGVIAAVIAAVALIVYLNHYRSSVNGNSEPLKVLVAKSLIQKGTPGSVVGQTALYQESTIAKDEVKTGAFVDPSTLAGKVATKDIYPGQQLTSADFAPATNSLSNQLARTERAVVVHLDSPNEVGGQIEAGSHVDVWVAYNGRGTNGVSRPIVHELYQNMTVLNTGTSGGNVTLQATSKEAGTLIFASENATIWLVLRPTIGSTDAKPPVISTNALLGTRALRTGG